MTAASARKPAFAVSAAFCLLLVLSCGNTQLVKPIAFGRVKEVLVICNDTLWNSIEADLRAKVEVPFRAVRPEPIFELAHANQQKVSYFKEWDKIILIESLERQQLLGDVVDDSTMKKISAGQGLFFSQSDIWARGQYVVGLAAPKEDELPRLVKLYGDRIFESFLHLAEAQEKERMFLSGVNQKLDDSLATCCGFSLLLPKVYARIMIDTLPPDQILLVHQDPVRSIFITWKDNPGPLDLSQSALAAGRDSLLAAVYPGMHTLQERIDTSTVVVEGLARIRVFGVWENRQEISGGIFVSHIIDLPERHRRYIIDCRLFAPDMRKSKFLFTLQFDQILKSFKLESH